MAKYTVVFFDTQSGKEQRTTFDGAPSESKIANWLSRRHGMPRFFIAARYYPSRKGWLVLDFSKASMVRSATGREFWKYVRRSRRVYPSEDAAAMVIRHRYLSAHASKD